MRWTVLTPQAQNNLNGEATPPHGRSDPAFRNKQIFFLYAPAARLPGRSAYPVMARSILYDFE